MQLKTYLIIVQFYHSSITKYYKAKSLAEAILMAQSWVESLGWNDIIFIRETNYPVLRVKKCLQLN